MSWLASDLKEPGLSGRDQGQAMLPSTHCTNFSKTPLEAIFRTALLLPEEKGVNQVHLNQQFNHKANQLLSGLSTVRPEK